MKYNIIAMTFLIFSISLMGCSSEQYVTRSRSHFTRADSLRMMKLQDVIAMSKAGVSDSLIISMMDATNSWFKLSTQDVLDLKNSGVSEKVINAMLEQPNEQTDAKSGSTNYADGYYAYPPYWWWYDGFYPYWYYPSFSIRFGHGFYHHGFAHHGRFR